MTSLGIQQFSDMVTEVGRAVDNTSTSLQASIKQHINHALGLAETANDWDQLLRVDESGLRDRADTTLATFESADAYSPMPWGARDIVALFYQDSSFDPPDIVTADELYRQAGSSLNNQSRPRFAAVIGHTAQYKKLAAAEILKLGTATSANANKVVRVHFLPSTAHVGNEAWEDVSTADYTTPVAMTLAAAAGYPLFKVTMPSGWVDNLSIYRNDGTTEIGSIERNEIPLTTSNSGQVVASRFLLRLWPVPEQDYKMTVGYRMWHPKLVEDEDTPLIPVSEFLVLKAAAAAARQLGDHSRAESLDREARSAYSSIQRKDRPEARPYAAPFRGDILGMTGVR